MSREYDDEIIYHLQAGGLYSVTALRKTGEVAATFRHSLAPEAVRAEKTRNPNSALLFQKECWAKAEARERERETFMTELGAGQRERDEREERKRERRERHTQERDVYS